MAVLAQEFGGLSRSSTRDGPPRRGAALFLAHWICALLDSYSCVDGGLPPLASPSLLKTIP